MKEAVLLPDSIHSLNEKVEFLSNPKTYADTAEVDVIETHMSWVFLTGKYVYKLKKPVCYDFLDFSTVESRHKYCMEEVRINKALAEDTYVDVIPLKISRGMLRLEGKGEAIDWLVKMKRLPAELMLHTALSQGTVRNEWVQQAAAKLVDFYLAAAPVSVSPEAHRRQIMADIEVNSTELLRNEFKSDHSVIIGIATDLFRFILKQTVLFDERISGGKIIDAHGDLRPEHICLGPKPVIIDRIEFNSGLRIMDIAEELSFLAMECDVLTAPAIGQLFFNVYKWKSTDKIPEVLILFFKAKRAFLRARLSIHHLLEEKYRGDEQRWRIKCDAYVKMAQYYCGLLTDKM